MKKIDFYILIREYYGWVFEYLKKKVSGFLLEDGLAIYHPDDDTHNWGIVDIATGLGVVVPDENGKKSRTQVLKELEEVRDKYEEFKKSKDYQASIRLFESCETYEEAEAEMYDAETAYDDYI